MAGRLSPLPNTLDELLVCPVCLEPYTQPKTLSCLHSFCTVCLESCKRPYRREISCPVCKRITLLSASGVQGLQDDFRIQQIRDILHTQSSSPVKPGASASNDEAPKVSESRECDLCKSRDRKVDATHHCSLCSMYFCKDCQSKHEVNPLFVTHHVVDLSGDKATEVFFCREHKDQAVRYFCRECGTMLCTICTFSHTPDHNPVALDKGIIQRYQQNLEDSLKSITSKLSEVHSRAKYLETLKQTHQRALYEAQRGIREKTAELIVRIKDQEKTLLQEVQTKMEEKMRGIGLDTLGELNFHKTNIQSLHNDVNAIIHGSPQQCLIAYEELLARMKSVSETSLPSTQTPSSSSVVKFVPSDEALKLIIGQLHECSLSDEQQSDQSPVQSTSYANLLATSASPQEKSVPRRVTSILNALSRNHKTEVKIGKVKAFFPQEPPRSPQAINADELMRDQGGSETDGAVASTSTTAYSSPDTPPASPVYDQPQLLSKPILVHALDQVGGWPGKIMSPSGMVFLPDGNAVIAECENRLQVFDKCGQSVRVIGWGKMKPHAVVLSRDKKLVITDKKDKCVKVYSIEGDQISAWGVGMFRLPSGITCMSSGNFVVTDIDTHIVSVHGPDGSLITQFGSWGCGDYQFNAPGYVAIGQHDHIIVSDTGNNFIKVYDHTGKFIRKFNFTGGSQSHIRHPHGVCVDQQGNILVADRDNHRICLFTLEGRFLRHVLTKADGIKYPCDIKVFEEQVAVVETHSGFLTKDPHHAVKWYQIYQ